MSSWKEKIFDDFWKYLVGAAGGSTVTSLMIRYIQIVPLWGWMTMSLLLCLTLALSLYLFYPILQARFYKRRFFSYWLKLKKCLIVYYVENDIEKSKLESDYICLVTKLNHVTSFYHLEIQDYLNKKFKNAGTKTGDLTLGHFKQCFSPTALKDWQKKINRRIPDELDVFDELAREISILNTKNLIKL